MTTIILRRTNVHLYVQGDQPTSGFTSQQTTEIERKRPEQGGNPLNCDAINKRVCRSLRLVGCHELLAGCGKRINILFSFLLLSERVSLTTKIKQSVHSYQRSVLLRGRKISMGTE